MMKAKGAKGILDGMTQSEMSIRRHNSVRAVAPGLDTGPKRRGCGQNFEQLYIATQGFP